MKKITQSGGNATLGQTRHVRNVRDTDVQFCLGLPDSQGLETFSRLHTAAPETPIVVISNVDDPSMAEEAVQLGAQDYLVQGRVSAASVARCIRYGVERKRRLLEREGAA